GLEIVATQLEFARARWGVKVHETPHQLLIRLLKQGIYCDSGPECDALDMWTLGDAYNFARAEAGIVTIATRAKRADSLWRRRQLGTWGSIGDDVIYPLIGWTKFDVLGYLKSHNIPLPPSSGKAATGIDLSEPSVCWLHDNFPADYRKLCEVFPYAE